MYIERELEKKIEKYLKVKEIVAVVGPRQSGKTTLLKKIYAGLKNAVFIDFEDRETLSLFNQNIKEFVELYVKKYDYLFMDEFQYAKEGGKNLKYIYDTCKIKIFISGSSSSELSIQGIKYLVGRIFVFNLYPLSFDEYLYYKDEDLYKLYQKNEVSETIINMINKHYEEFLIFGGYPRVVISNSVDDKIEVLKNIYNTYFLKEIKEILQLQDDFKLSKLIKVLSLQIGGIANYNELSSACGFNYQELMKNLNILNKTYICIEARPFFTNKKSEIVKSPKIFFLDSGFRNITIHNFQKLEDRPDMGNLNENYTASELFKRDLELKYWRTKVGAESDFVIEHNGEITPLEVKSELKTPKVTKSLMSFFNTYKPKKGFVLSLKLYGNKNNVNFAPLFSIGKILKTKFKT